MRRFLIFARLPHDLGFGLGDNHLGDYDRAEQLLDNLRNLDSGPFAERLRASNGQVIDIMDTWLNHFRSLYIHLDTHHGLIITERNLTQITAAAYHKQELPP